MTQNLSNPSVHEFGAAQVSDESLKGEIHMIADTDRLCYSRRQTMKIGDVKTEIPGKPSSIFARTQTPGSFHRTDNAPCCGSSANGYRIHDLSIAVASSITQHGRILTSRLRRQAKILHLGLHATFRWSSSRRAGIPSYGARAARPADGHDQCHWYGGD